MNRMPEAAFFNGRRFTPPWFCGSILLALPNILSLTQVSLRDQGTHMMFGRTMLDAG